MVLVGRGTACTLMHSLGDLERNCHEIVSGSVEDNKPEIKQFYVCTCKILCT